MSSEPLGKTDNDKSEELKSLRAEYSLLLSEVQELERVHYLCLLEISSLNCEKDFLLSSLDEIDALILKRHKDEESKVVTPATKRTHSTDITEESKRQNTNHGSASLEPSEPIHAVSASDKPEPVKAEQPLQPNVEVTQHPNPYQQYPYPVPQGLPYQYIPSIDLSQLPSTFYGQQGAQYIQMMQNYHPEATSTHYAQIPQPAYPILSPTSSFFVVNSPRGVPGQVDHTRDLTNPYMALNLPHGGAQPNAAYIAKQVPQQQQ